MNSGWQHPSAGGRWLAAPATPLAGCLPARGTGCPAPAYARRTGRSVVSCGQPSLRHLGSDPRSVHRQADQYPPGRRGGSTPGGTDRLRGGRERVVGGHVVGNHFALPGRRTTAQLHLDDVPPHGLLSTGGVASGVPVNPPKALRRRLSRILRVTGGVNPA